MSDYRGLTAAALAATTVTGRASFSWFGMRQGVLPAETEAQLAPKDARAYLVFQIQTHLYGAFYTQGSATATLADAQLPAGLGPSEFVHHLSTANRGTGSLESGWTPVAEDGGRVVVERGGLRIWAEPAAVAPQAGGVALRMPKELLRLSPGYYMALGNRELPTDGAAAVVRFYWNLRSESAVALVDGLTRRLNDADIAFRLKVVSDPARYTRCDSGVLYTLRSDYVRTVSIVARVHAEVAPALGAPTPAYTKALAPGVALAEDPGVAAESFGQSRCRLLAESIVDAAEAGVESPAERVELVAQRFRREGLDLDRPYLNPGSADDFRWPA